MGHEIFFKILDGPQNIFQCSIFVILFLNSGDWSTKYQNWPSRIFKKDMLNNSHPLSRYKANSGKNKIKCLMHFDANARVFVLSN